MERGVLVVDGGFGWVKWLYGEGRGKFRSCYKRVGGELIWGERALLESGSRYLRTVEELMEMYPEIVREVERVSGVKERGYLVLGLPYGYFESVDVESVEEFRGRVRRRCGYSEVMVFPQGLGGVKWYLRLLRDRGVEVEGNVLGIDIGFNTVIVVLYSVMERRILIGRTYYRKGVYDLAVNLLYPRVERFVRGRSLTPIELNYLMESGYLQVGFDRVDLRPEVGEAVEEYVRDLLGFIVHDLKASLGVVTFGRVVFFGGGSFWLRGRVSGRSVIVDVLEDAEFANAYGFRERAIEVIGEGVR